MPYHVVPQDDLYPHTEEGTTCSCQPRVLWHDPETGHRYADAMVIHHAFDGRELFEPDAPHPTERGN